MFYIHGGMKAFGGLLLLLFLVAACSFNDNTNNTSSNSNNNNSSNKVVTVTTNQGVLSNKSTPVTVKAKAVQGSSTGKAGSGPIVVTAPTRMPGGGASSQQVVLKDRTLMIVSVSKQNTVNATSSLVTLTLMVKNTGNRPIMNQPTFFQLMGNEGDTFSYQSNSSDNFYGTVAANSAHNGTIVFQLPVAAAHNLRLLYRPEIATETALVALNV